MKKAKSALQLQQKLREYFRYECGLLVRVKDNRKWKSGAIMGTKDKNGYLCSYFDGKYYKVHHLIWLYHYGYLPQMLDHINRDPGDNRIENLREADKRINSINTGKQKNNTSGVRGVSWDKRLKKWEAYIHSYGKKKSLGFYDDLEDASKARAQAEIESDDFRNYG